MATVALVAVVVVVVVDNECDCQLRYKESSGGQGQLTGSEPADSKHLPQSTRSSTSVVACFPLHALLVALNRTTVDYFSLDVEGFELDVRTARYMSPP